MNWTEEQLAGLEESRRMTTPFRRKPVPKEPVKKLGRVKGIAPMSERMYAGRLYHSKAEMQMAVKLDLLKKAGTVTVWFAQTRFPLRVPRIDGVLIATLVADFDVYYTDGTREVIEVKGWESDIYKLKRKLFAALYPEVTYTVVKV